MKLPNMKLIGLSSAIAALCLCSFGAYAEDGKATTPMNQDQINGRVDEAKGTVKEVTGKILDDKGMEIKGNIQKNVGKAQKGYGDLKHDIKDGK